MLISDHYREQNRLLHEDRPDYGASGARWAPLVAHLAEAFHAQSVLDYGCGKQTLAASLPDMNIRGYDPAIEGLDAAPEPADLVICTDVLEHIEPANLAAVIEDLRRVTKAALFVAIHTGPAKKALPDGRNAHLIQLGYEWWLPRLWPHFGLLNATIEPLQISALFRAKEAA